MNPKEKTYPIYEIDIRLIIDGEHNPEYPKWHEGLPEGRVKDRITAIVSFPYEPSAAEVNQKLAEMLEASLNRDRAGDLPKLKDLNPDIISQSITYLRRDNWIDSWFSHYTYNIELSDGELLASFEEYVSRHLSKHYAEKMCLMGAEDAWRWKDPCRCDGCKEKGIVRIDH